MTKLHCTHRNVLSDGCIQTSTCTHSHCTWPDEEEPLCSTTGPQTHTQFSFYAAIRVATKVVLVLLFGGFHASAADKCTIPLCLGLQVQLLCACCAPPIANAEVWRGPGQCDEDSSSCQAAVGSDDGSTLVHWAKADEVRGLTSEDEVWCRPGEPKFKRSHGWRYSTISDLCSPFLVQKTNMFNYDLWDAHDVTFAVGHTFLWFDFYDRNHFFC